MLGKCKAATESLCVQREIKVRCKVEGETTKEDRFVGYHGIKAPKGHG